MIYHHRLLEDRLTRMAGQMPVVTVLGARQAGKSTLLEQLFGAGARTFVFDPTVDVGEARRDPETFLRLNPPPLVLDEVQFAPELLPVLKRLVDERRGEAGLYFLSGSQNLAVIAAVRESLAGRSFLADLWPMSRGELTGAPRGGLVDALYGSDPPADAFALAARLREAGPPSLPAGNLYERIFRGGYPRLLDMGTSDVPAWHDSYVRTYVERDVRTLRDVSEPHDFSRFLRLVAAITAREVNLSQLGREIGVSPRTARAWLDALVASYQVRLLDPWSGSTVKRVSGRPKVHAVDTGVACHLLAVSSPQALTGHRDLGALFESYAVGELLKQCAALDVAPRPWHWRTLAGAEVDLVLERDGAVTPFEIRLAARPTRRDLSGLRAFRETYEGLPTGPGIVIHGGAELFLLDERTVAVPMDWV
jgi:predicted AAA+ superfamily ATPase